MTHCTRVLLEGRGWSKAEGRSIFRLALLNLEEETEIAYLLSMGMRNLGPRPGNSVFKPLPPFRIEDPPPCSKSVANPDPTGPSCILGSSEGLRVEDGSFVLCVVNDWALSPVGETDALTGIRRISSSSGDSDGLGNVTSSFSSADTGQIGWF